MHKKQENKENIAKDKTLVRNAVLKVKEEIAAAGEN